MQWLIQWFAYFTGGRDPPLAQCGLKKIIAETLNSVGHR